MHLTRTEIDQLESRKRAALINSLTGFKPAVLVATADASGNSNLAIMSSLVHIGSNPPLLALVFRPDSVERHSLENIRATGAYTLNHVHDTMVDAAHQTAARYPREVSEFAATGLSACWSPGFTAPFVAQARVRLGMRFCEEHTLAINGTHLVIGEILTVEIPEDSLTGDGALDPAHVDSVAIGGLDSYYRASLLQRMAYASPDRPPRRLED